MSVRRCLAWALVAVSLFASSCSSDTPEVSAVDGGQLTLTSEPGAMVGRMPVGADGTILMTATSLNRVDTLIERTRDCASPDALDGWIGTAIERFDQVPWTPDVVIASTRGRLDDEFGVSLCDVNWVAQDLTGNAPGWLLTAEVDAARLDASVREHPSWGEGTFSIGEAAGTEFFDWGDDSDPARITAFRDLGVGGQLGVVAEAADGADVVVRTETREAMRRTLVEERTLSGESAALVALPIIAASEPVSIMITNDVATWVDVTGADGPAPWWLLSSFELLAAAEGFDDAGRFLEVVIVHQSAIDAEANVTNLQAMFDQGASQISGEPWAEIFTVESIGSRDATLVARIRTTDDVEIAALSVVMSSLVAGDSLFATR